MSYLLHPPLLDEVGLAAALRLYTEGLSERGVLKVAVELEDEFPRMASNIEIAAFRVIQECLTNVHRHSGSKTARIAARVAGNELKIEVEDQGNGMTHDQLLSFREGRSGVGTQGIRERVLHANGKMTVQSSPQGTKLSFTFPL